MTEEAAGKSLKISGSADEPVPDANWQDDLGRRMLEKMGQAIPHLEGLGDLGDLGTFSKKVVTNDQVPSGEYELRNLAARVPSARKSDSADEGEEADVWDKLLHGGLSQKDIEWVRIKSFMDEKKK